MWSKTDRKRERERENWCLIGEDQATNAADQIPGGPGSQPDALLTGGERQHLIKQILLVRI